MVSAFYHLPDEKAHSVEGIKAHQRIMPLFRSKIKCYELPQVGTGVKCHDWSISYWSALKMAPLPSLIIFPQIALSLHWPTIMFFDHSSVVLLPLLSYFVFLLFFKYYVICALYQFLCKCGILSNILDFCSSCPNTNFWLITVLVQMLNLIAGLLQFLFKYWISLLVY